MAKPIALQLYSLRQLAKEDFPAVLKSVARMGYAGVEYAGLNKMSAKDVAAIVKDLGLGCPSAHVGLPTRETIDQFAADAAVLGYKRIISGLGGDNMKTADGVKTCADRFAEACRLAKSVGLTFGMHNHWWEFNHKFDGKSPYQMLLEMAPDMFSELDVYWCAHAKEDPAKVTKTFAKRIPLLHLKDGDLSTPPVHKAIGDGKIEIKKIVEAADTATLDWLIVELDSCATDMSEAVAKSCQYLIRTGLGSGMKK